MKPGNEDAALASPSNTVQTALVDGPSWAVDQGAEMMANSSGPCAQLATSVVTWLHREPEITGGGWPGVGYSDPSPRPRKSRCSDHSIVPGVLGWLPKLTSGSPGRRRKRRKSCLSSGGRAIAKASSETPDESRKTIVTMSINNVFVRNARGLNDRARRNVVWEFLIQERRPPWPVSKRQKSLISM